MYQGPHGGYIGKNEVYNNDNFSFILGQRNDTYLSLYPGYNITLKFVDEVIFTNDTNEKDLIIDTYLNSSTQAHVSVSYDNIHFHRIGILNNTNKRFSTAKHLHNHQNKYKNYNFEKPIAYVNLHFFGDSEALNIVRVYGKSDLYAPQNSYYLTLPEMGNDIYYFYNDCNYGFNCYSMCYYTSGTFDREDSCMYGCDIFDYNRNCFCERYPNGSGVETIPFFGNEFQMDYCNRV